MLKPLRILAVIVLMGLVPTCKHWQERYRIFYVAITRRVRKDLGVR
jgi:hypothetical protein